MAALGQKLSRRLFNSNRVQRGAFTVTLPTSCSNQNQKSAPTCLNKRLPSKSRSKDHFFCLALPDTHIRYIALLQDVKVKMWIVWVFRALTSNRMGAPLRRRARSPSPKEETRPAQVPRRDRLSARLRATGSPLSSLPSARYVTCPPQFYCAQER